jgi:hypothetical protein
VELRGRGYEHKSQLPVVVIDFGIEICGELYLTKDRFRQITSPNSEFDKYES